MLKSLTTLFLLAAFLVQSVNRFAVVVDYYTNTAAFAKDCENKALPQLHCNGKCQMMKKMKEQEKKETQSSAKKFISIELIGAKEELSLFTFVPEDELIYFSFNTGKTSDIAGTFFHPPGFMI